MLLSQMTEILSQYWWLLIIFFCIGFVFCVIEVLTPSFGFFGIAGIVLFVGGVVYYALMGAAAWKVVLLVIAIILFIVGCFFWISKSVKNGILSKSPFFDSKTALPQDYDNKKKAENVSLMGKYAVAETDLRPVGNIRMESNEVLQAFAKTEFIQKGAKVEIVAIESDKIIVEEVISKSDNQKTVEV